MALIMTSSISYNDNKCVLCKTDSHNFIQPLDCKLFYYSSKWAASESNWSDNSGKICLSIELIYPLEFILRRCYHLVINHTSAQIKVLKSKFSFYYTKLVQL